MCGIFGVVNGKHFRALNGRVCDFVRDGMIANAVRGQDSTGVMQMDSKNLLFFKAPIGGGEFVKHQSVHGYIYDADNSLFTVVHNRAATEGVVNRDNAHPFSHFGKTGNYVMGVHNGTLRNWRSADETFEVDSDWAIKQLADEGIAALQKFQGAFAFVWYDDSEPNELQFARNAERPMFVAFIKGQNRMVFGSEYQMLTWLASRNSLELDAEIIELANNYHYKFQLDNPKLFTKQYFESAKLGDKLLGVCGPTCAPPEAPRMTAKDSLVAEIKSLFETTGPKVVKKDETKAEPYVTAEEVRMAKRNGSFNIEVNFIMEHYDEQCQALWGTCEDQFGEIATAVIRRVDKATYDSWKRATSLIAKVYGAMLHEVADTVDTMYILSRSKIKVNELPEHNADSSLALAIKKSMEVHEKAKNEQHTNNQTVH
jgi:hypothetical protein